jgi:hypothetical protein
VSQSVNSGVPLPQGIGEDPLSHYTRIFTRFLQLVFASFEKNSYQWSPDENSSDILIHDQATVAKEAVERRPAIVVARGPASFANIAIDQLKDYDLNTGRRTHTDLISATMSYNCLAPEGLEAQKIAWVCAYATRTLKRSLMKAGIHRVGEDIQIGAESPPGSIIQPDTDEVTLVSVHVPFYAQQTWSVEPVDKVLLKGIKIDLRSDFREPPEEEILKPPMMYGKVLVNNRVRLDSSVKVTTKIGPKK